MQSLNELACLFPLCVKDCCPVLHNEDVHIIFVFLSSPVPKEPQSPVETCEMSMYCNELCYQYTGT